MYFMTIEINKNNFKTYQNDFKKDTGFDASEPGNYEKYVAYYQARILDSQMQVQFNIANQLFGINQLLQKAAMKQQEGK